MLSYHLCYWAHQTKTANERYFGGPTSNLQSLLQNNKFLFKLYKTAVIRNINIYLLTNLIGSELYCTWGKGPSVRGLFVTRVRRKEAQYSQVKKSLRPTSSGYTYIRCLRVCSGTYHHMHCKRVYLLP